MAPPAGTLRVGRYFLTISAMVVVLYGLVFMPGQRHTPKLGLDLQGGKQVVYQAKTPSGSTPSKSAMSEARQIMEDRVNGSGVAQAEVVIQGSNQIAVSIPGKSTKDISKLGEAAQLNFRPLVMPPVGVTPPSSAPSSTGSTTPSGSTSSTTTPSTSAPATTPAGASPSPSLSGQNAQARPLAPATTSATPKASTSSTPKASASATPKASASPTPTASTPAAKTSDPFKGMSFPLPKSDTEYNKLTSAQQQELQGRLASYKCDTDQPDGQPQRSQDFIACDSKDPSKASLAFLLGPVIVPGTEISSASAQPPNFSGTGGSAQWTVSLSLKSSGSRSWANYTSAHNTGGQDINTSISQCGSSATPCADYVAFTLDGAVISSPYNRDAINGQATQISGGFNEDSATTLARQLKYGALPLNFSVLTNTDVSATLGTAQLKAGLLAGGIGLILVVLYSLIYYRALGLVTIASLLVSGVLTYACLVILGREIGFTLTLAGIAGFIVAVGITADSFVVFFERIKDEVHGGRSMRVAIPRAWVRARRTILSADTVSFLAAAVLYYFAAGDVRGFAFTLGLSTILDLVVVFLFTHPMVSLLSRSAAFGSARFTGLNAIRGEPAPEFAGDAPAPAPRVRRARTAAAATRARKAAPVAVLDEADAGSDAVAEDTQADRTAEPVVTEEASTEPPPADEPEPQYPRSAPQPGTAAERAAARRARMRAEAGDREKGQR